MATATESVDCIILQIRAGSVVPVLDSLAALGLVVRYEKNGERMWKAAGR
jgi:hypothetical protein